MYCVEWNTRNASPARKSRDDRSPATGRSVNPVQSARNGEYYTLTANRKCNQKFDWEVMGGVRYTSCLLLRIF